VFGVVFLEALACGVPVIGSKVDGSHEAFGQLGCLVDPNVPAEELVKAIAEVLCNGSSRQRNNLVRCFDVAHFRSRAAEWLMERTTKDQSLGVSARRPRSGETWMMGVRRRFAAHKM
jgi:glycosyltransferase involved in cell wall biosynthesis